MARVPFDPATVKGADMSEVILEVIRTYTMKSRSLVLVTCALSGGVVRPLDQFRDAASGTVVAVRSIELHFVFEGNPTFGFDQDLAPLFVVGSRWVQLGCQAPA